MSQANRDDVLVSLDGDDRFACNYSLEIIKDAYQHECWMTYGSWISSNGGPAGFGMWPAYPEGTNDFRH